MSDPITPRGAEPMTDAELVAFRERITPVTAPKIGGSFSARQVFEGGECIGMNAWCTASECGWFHTYGDGSASSITDARRRWDAHWRDGECGGERCLGDRSWANYDDARLLAQLQRVKRQEQSDD